MRIIGHIETGFWGPVSPGHPWGGGSPRAKSTGFSTHCNLWVLEMVPTWVITVAPVKRFTLNFSPACIPRERCNADLLWCVLEGLPFVFATQCDTEIATPPSEPVEAPLALMSSCNASAASFRPEPLFGGAFFVAASPSLTRSLKYR